MRRSELARAAGCHGETVRFYEHRGLLPAPPRSAAGHRIYGREHAHRLRFIVRARELGFGLDEITQLLRLSDDGSGACAEARALTSARLDQVRRKIADLGRLEQALRTMVARCDHHETGGCPMIDSLSERAAPPEQA